MKKLLINYIFYYRHQYQKKHKKICIIIHQNIHDKYNKSTENFKSFIIFINQLMKKLVFKKIEFFFKSKIIFN